MREVEIVQAADKAGFKYVWASENHFLHEYSHMSDSGAFLAYCAALTERIHLATGIRNLSPQVNHPVRVAEEVAMMDHLTGGRFELGTGRGAGWHEVQGFGIPDTAVTKDWWHEVIRELPRMWREIDYTHEDGDVFRIEGPRMILPKPYGNSHPPLWVAAGSPQTWEMAGALGLGAIGFSTGSIDSMGPKVESYKRAVETEGIPDWPEQLPEPDLEMIEAGIEGGFLACGTPHEVVEQLKRYEATGVDQVAFSLPVDIPQDIVLETIELLGEHVIPVYDEPEFRTDRMRAAADVTPWPDQAVPRTTGPGPEPSAEGTRPM